MGLTVDKFTDIFERGHVYGQSTGRLMTVDDIETDNSVLGHLTKLSVLLDEASSSLNTTNHIELLASIKKDFKGADLAMNIEFQLKYADKDSDSGSGLGNQDTGKLASILNLVSSYRKLMTKGIRRTDGSFMEYPKIVSDTEIVAILKGFEDKITKNFDKLQKVLSQHISYAQDPNFLVNLKSSTTLKQYIAAEVVSIFKDNRHTKPVKIAHPKIGIAKVTTEYKAQASKLKKIVSNIKSDTDKAKALLKTKKDTLGKLSRAKVVKADTSPVQTLNLANLQNLLDRHLQDVVAANMGDGNERRVLNYRTGRLAESAKVEGLSESRAGMITAFYSYMRNPYGTFSDGGKQQYPKTRDPKTLIGNSIREIAATVVGNRLRAVLV